MIEYTLQILYTLIDKLLIYNIFYINRIRNYSPDLTTSEINDALRNALQIWGDAIPNTFRRVHVGSADIEIRWVFKNKLFLIKTAA